jgi:bacillithiol synthase
MKITEQMATPYPETGKYGQLVMDYVNNSLAVPNLYTHEPTKAGMEAALKERPVGNRAKLVAGLKEQYAGLQVNPVTEKQLELLAKPNTYTITTAHQPNIFTGYWYVIYKICHVIALSRQLAETHKGYEFVPVFYLGSEDNDLDELGSIKLNGKKYTWETEQTGAVGRMQVDEKLELLRDTIITQTAHEPFGTKLTELLKLSYTKGTNLEQATFLFIHSLFAEYGLVILLPDRAVWKEQIKNIIWDDITQNKAQVLVEETSNTMAHAYKVQAHARDINLFLLSDGKRDRIEKTATGYAAGNTSYTEAELKLLLDTNPEKFSPNVILRGILQETILPNVAFVGGGGELAYWLQLRKVFDLYKVYYPMLVLRQSFTIMEHKDWQEWQKLGVGNKNLFEHLQQKQNSWVKTHDAESLDIQQETTSLLNIYSALEKKALNYEQGLATHIKALQKKHSNVLAVLQKKFIRQSKRKHEEVMRKLQKLEDKYFINGGLQERSDNFLIAYSKYGKVLLETLINNCTGLQGAFKTLVVE